MKSLLISTLLLVLICSCQQIAPAGKASRDSYLVGQVPILSSFEKLNRYELEREQEVKRKHAKGSADGQADEMVFRNNRMRLHLESFTNGKRSAIDSVFYYGFPMECDCRIAGDTISITGGAGFFGGFGVGVKIFGSRFSTWHYQYYADGTKPYKYALTDTAFSKELILQGKDQSLIINEQPTFKPGQQLTGFATFTTPVYYVQGYDTTDANYDKVKLYFTCTTR